MQGVNQFNQHVYSQSSQQQGKVDFAAITSIHCDCMRNIINCISDEGIKEAVFQACNLRPNSKPSGLIGQSLENSLIKMGPLVDPLTALDVIQKTLVENPEKIKLNDLVISLVDYQEVLASIVDEMSSQAGNTAYRQSLNEIKEISAVIIRNALEGDNTTARNLPRGSSLQMSLKKQFEAQRSIPIEECNVVEEDVQDDGPQKVRIFPRRDVNEVNSQDPRDLEICELGYQISSCNSQLSSCELVDYCLGELINLNSVQKKNATENRNQKNLMSQDYKNLSERSERLRDRLSGLGVKLDNTSDSNKLERIRNQYKEHQAKLKGELENLKLEQSELIVDGLSDKISEMEGNVDSLRDALASAESYVAMKSHLNEIGGDEHYNEVDERVRLAGDKKRYSSVPKEDIEFINYYEHCKTELVESFDHFKKSGLGSHKLDNEEDLAKLRNYADKMVDYYTKEMDSLQRVRHEHLENSMRERTAK